MMKSLGAAEVRPVKDIMNINYKAVYPGDSLRRIIQIYDETKLDTLPVLDKDNKLMGVFSRRRLYKALLECSSLDDPCDSYIVPSPRVNHAEKPYDPISMVEKVFESRVGNVPVIDPAGKVVGMIGKLEYLRETVRLLTGSYALLEAILLNVCLGMIVMDNSGKIIIINKYIEDMFAMNLAEIQGRHLEEVFPEILWTDLDFSKKSHYRCQRTIRYVPVIIGAVPIIANGKQIGVNITLKDVSDIEQIAREYEKAKELQTVLSGVLNASSYGIFFTGKEGKIQYTNKMAGQLLGISAEAVVGRSLEDFMPANTHSRVTENGLAEVDICPINGTNSVITHMPIKNNENDKLVGVVSTVYSTDNILTEEITRKWFSLRQQVSYYKEELEKRGGVTGTFDMIVSNNASFIKIKNEAQRVARSTSTILLTGESGVGKDMFARAIHSASPRGKLSFIKVNCAAIPETLLESELFGYAAGSFTGASKKGKPGYFEQADRGTIFLDEIGDMPLSVQVKLLQVIQDKQFMRVGGTRLQKVDVRILAATNHDLRKAIAKGAFREDLYYRLNVIELKLPPLRARADDIIPLSAIFIQKCNHILGTNVIGITKEAREVLRQYNWPGNIRELENAIERAVNYVWEGEIDVEHLPSHVLNPEQEAAPIVTYQTVLQDIDKDIILDALKTTRGNKSAAARLLKISRSAFYEKLIRYGLM